MKHFGAILSGDNNVVDGGDSSILTIGESTAAQGVANTQDSIVIYNVAGPTGATDKTTSSAGFVLVPSATGRGATHVIGADGREIAISTISGTFNPTAGTIPLAMDGSDADTDPDSWADSALTQTGTSTSSTVTAAGNLTVNGNLQVLGTTTNINSTQVDIADAFITLADTDLPVSNTTPVSNINGGILVETDRTSDGTTETKTYGGLRYNATTNQWEASSDTNATGVGTWTPFGMAGASVTAIQGGDGVTVATTGMVDGLTASTNTPVASVAVTAAGISSSTVAGGGLGIDAVTGNGNNTLGIAFGGITAGQFATAISTTRTGLANGTAGQVLQSQGNGGFSWGDATGSVRKYGGNQTVVAGVISIPAATHGLSTTDTDYSVKIYEYQDTSGNQVTGSTLTAATRYNEIFPEAVTIGRLSAGTGTELLGTVTITLPTSQNSNIFRVVIKS